MFKLVCVAVSKHEGRYIKDWIDWHLKLGIDKFYLYDEASEHLTHKVLEPYVWADIVEYLPATKHPTQYQAYEHAVLKLTDKTDWILFIDIDEFVVLNQEPYDLKKFLAQYTHPNIGAVSMAWACFGSNAKDVYEASPVWKRIFRRVDYEDTAKHHTRHIKSFVRPQCVQFPIFDPHLFQMKPGYYTVDSRGRKLTTSEWASDNFPMDKIWLAHYSTKTREEWAWKFARGSADSGPEAYNARKFEMFDQHMKACLREDMSVLNLGTKLGL